MQDGRFRLYRGRSYAESPEGPFSFVPSRPFVGRPLSFARPALRLPSQWMTENLAQGAKVTPAPEKEIGEIWREIVRQTIDTTGLAMGVRLDCPPPLAR